MNPLLKRPAELSKSFDRVYNNQFLNYGDLTRYSPLNESGDLLIICYDAWMGNVQPLADHKSSMGIDTTIVGVSTIGNNATSIKNYIQGVYNGGTLAFVLLVGDASQVATPYASGGASDPSYAKLAGGDDYPDIVVGRFSAETAAQVDTQVERTIEYETMGVRNTDWFWRGTGVASDQGPGDDGEYDYQHLNNIRTDLLGYGFTLVDQIYDPSGTASQVSAALNNGRGFVNYTGHGSTTSWSTTGFSNTNVNALVNDSMLPFICSVACVNGEFDGYTCFAEAWLRATNGGAPTGAIGVYMSSINQSWDPPMCAQDEMTDCFCAEDYFTLGALCFASSCQMIDEYGADGVEMYDTWHVFGDPSLNVLATCSDVGTLGMDAGKYNCTGTVGLALADCGLDTTAGFDTATVTATSDSDPTGITVMLTEVGAETGQFEGVFYLGDQATPDALVVLDGDTITVTYQDADTGDGSPATVIKTAPVDCSAPQILDVQTIAVEPRAATIQITADEVIAGTVHYGPSCDNLLYAASGGFGDPATVAVTGLQDATTYFYSVEAQDEAGNVIADDNGGSCYTFSTPDIPDFFTENFDELPSNDLAYQVITFTPNGSYDFYDGCVEAASSLPTDPAGSTSITLSDDDSESITLTGATVSLYGVSYGSFYVGSNGYITFGQSDTDYTESLDDHFSLPRISALFDDLTPTTGSVSWKQARRPCGGDVQRRA